LAQEADDIKIAKWKEDLAVLPYTHTAIAQKIGISKSNFSGYVNGRISVTYRFLKRFYTVFQDELDNIWEMRRRATEEDLQPYKESASELIMVDMLNKKFTAADERMMQSHDLIMATIAQLEYKITQLTELVHKFQLPLSLLEPFSPGESKPAASASPTKKKSGSRKTKDGGGKNTTS
jgi:transcriptional regulator with XRE-family HTH domain